MNVVERFYMQKTVLSNIKLLKLEQFDLGYMLSDDIALFLSFGIRKFVFFKMFIPVFFDTSEYVFDKIAKGDVIVFSSAAYSERLDYRNMLNTFKRIVPNTKNWIEINKYSINKNFIEHFKLLLIWNRELKKYIGERKERFFLLKQLLKCYKLLLKLQPFKDNMLLASCAVCQFDALDKENLFSQYCKLLGIPTATLQHGHFHRTEYIDEENFFISTPFEGFVSDYFLAWGDYTRLEAMENGIDERRIISVGSLKNNCKTIGGSVTFNTFGVILNGTLGYDENDRLIEYAEKIHKKWGLKYIIRPHPTKGINPDWCTRLGFEGISDSLDESVFEMTKSVDFCLCGNSSVLTELVYMELPVLTLHPENSVDTYERASELSFADENGLWEILGTYFYDKTEYKKNILRSKRLFFAEGDIEKTYRDAINNISRHGGIVVNDN